MLLRSSRLLLFLLCPLFAQAAAIVNGTPLNIPTGTTTTVTFNSAGSLPATTWLSTCPTFSFVNSTYGASISSISCTSNTTATASITTPSTPGALNILDSTDSVQFYMNVHLPFWSDYPFLVNGETGVAVSLHGTGTAWTTSSPTFSISGCATASKVSQSVTNDTTATITLNAGTTNCTITVTDSSTTKTLTVAVRGPLQTYYVAPYGSTRYSTDLPKGGCNGTANTPYPGLTSNLWWPSIVFASTGASTTATWASGSNTITVASATGIIRNQTVTGTGIPSGTMVLKISGTTVTLTQNTTASGSSAAVSFAYVIVDSNGRYQTLTTAGTAGTSAPAWASSGTTTDGTAVWTATSGAPGVAPINQACPFNDYRFTFLTGQYGVESQVMGGGDTLVVYGCNPAITQQNATPPYCRIGPDQATGSVYNGTIYYWCAGPLTHGCSIPPPPSGSPAHHTQILGSCATGSYTCTPVTTYPYTSNNLAQIFGGFALGPVFLFDSLDYVDMEGLEITSHNGACSTAGTPVYPKGCSISSPADDFAKYGISTTNQVANWKLQDVYIHGLSQLAIGGPVGNGTITVNRVILGFTAFALWNFDDGFGTPNDSESVINQSYLTLIGGGFLEQYPIVNTQFPALAGWDSGTGGFGDSWSGQNSAMTTFTCDHCQILYNAKDGAMGPHTTITNISLTNSLWVGNMGQDGKWGQPPGATFLFENNLIVGNCMRMTAQLPGAAQNFDLSTGLGGSYLTTYCRAAGTIFDYFAGTGATVNFTNNTIVGYQPSFFDFGCAPPTTCTTTPYNITNNIFWGVTSTYSVSPFNPGVAPGLFVNDDGTVDMVSKNNIENGVNTSDTCGVNGILCTSPLFVSQPTGSVPPETTLDSFNFNITSGSPAIHAGTTPCASTDYAGNAQTSPCTMGALVFPSGIAAPTQLQGVVISGGSVN